MNKYVGLRYVPIFDGAWDKNKKYEHLVIVEYQGNSYTSKTNVPIGIDILDENFWVCTGNYNAQVEMYRQEVKRTSDKCNELNNFIVSNALNVKMFGATGDGVTDDTIAIQNAIDEAIKNGKSVFLPGGVYLVDNLEIKTKNSIRFFGEQISNPNKNDNGTVLLYKGNGNLFTLGLVENGLLTPPYGSTFSNFSVRAIQKFSSVFYGATNECVFSDLNFTFSPQNTCDYGFNFTSCQLTEVKNISTSRVKTFINCPASMILWVHHNNIWISDNALVANWGNYIFENNSMEQVYNAVLIDNAKNTANTELSININNNYLLSHSEMLNPEKTKLFHVIGNDSGKSLRVNANISNNIIDGVEDKKIEYPIEIDRKNTTIDDGTILLNYNVFSNVEHGILKRNGNIIVIENNNRVGSAYFAQNRLYKSSNVNNVVNMFEDNIELPNTFLLNDIFLPRYQIEGRITTNNKVTLWIGGNIICDFSPVDGAIYFKCFVVVKDTQIITFTDINGVKGKYITDTTEYDKNKIYFNPNSNATLDFMNISLQ